MPYKHWIVFAKRFKTLDLKRRISSENFPSLENSETVVFMIYNQPSDLILSVLIWHSSKPGGGISRISWEHFSQVGIWVARQKWPIDVDLPGQKEFKYTHYLKDKRCAYLPLTSRGRMSGKCVRGWILGGVGGGTSISTSGVSPKYSATTGTASWVIFVGRRTWTL